MDFIRITALTDIGNNIAYSSLVPVVDMAGTPTTKKANLQIVGNLILNGAGGTYFAPAARSVLAQTVTNAAQPNITSVGTLSNLVVSGNVNLGLVGNINIGGGNPGQLLATNGNGGLSWVNDPSGVYSNSNVANYLPTFTGTVGANTIRSTANSGSNVQIDANGAVFMFGQGGALQWPAPGGAQWVIEPNIDDEFEIKSTSNVVISTDISNANSHFTFDSDGIFTAPSNVNLLGSRLNVGPDAANAANLLNPTLVIANSGSQYIQAAIINNNPNGSADLSADGAGGGDDEAWTDMGFAGYTFNDANYTITEPGDGYLFVQGYANGLGGNMVLATGDHSNTADIIFATGGFLANNEFARIDHANDVFHLTRAGSGIKFADGTIQTTAGGGGGSGAALVNGDNSFVLNANGNVVFEGDEPGQGVNRGLVWDFGANANGVNSELRQDNIGITIRAWTEQGGGANGYSAPVNIITNQDADEKQWVFDGDGNLTLPGNLRMLAGNIVSDEITPTFNSAITGITTGNVTVIVTITDSPFEGPVQGQVTISSVTGTTEANGIWYYEAVEENQFQLYIDDTYTTPVDGTFWTPYVSGGTAASNGTYLDLTIQGGNISINNNGEIWTFGANGVLTIPNDIISNRTIDIDNRVSGNTSDINIYSADDILLQARDRATGSTSEGGDINIFAGDSAEDSDSTGGDVVIEAGNGGASNTDFGGDGGFIRLQAGRGGAASTGGGASALDGGTVTLRAGNGGDNNGNIARGAQGGDIVIDAGDSTGNGQTGGEIFISSGQAGANGLAGRVQISTPVSDSGPGGTWIFDGNGNLTLPNESKIATISNVTRFDTGPNGALGLNSYDAGSNNVARVNISSIDEVVSIGLSDPITEIDYNWTFDITGNLTSPSNLVIGPNPNVVGTNIIQDDASLSIVGVGANSNVTAGWAESTSAPGNIAVISFNNPISGTGNVSISTGNNGGTQYDWTFDNTGNLILAGGNSVIQSVANSSLDPLNPNVSTMRFVPDSGYSSQSLVLDPTLPGHIHLRAPGGNIDEPYANIFLGGEESSFEVGYYTGSAPNVFIHSGGNTWEFLNDGNLVFPRDAVGNTDPFLRITGGANPRILSEDVSLAGPANLEITALNTIFTGSSGSAIKIYADDGEIGSTANLQIWANSGGNTEYSWTFDTDGNLTLPGNISLSTANGIIDSTSNLEIYSGTDGNNGAYLALGSGSGNIGGDVSIISGEGTVTTGGNIILQGGIGNTKGGNATLQGGSGLGAGGNGGDVEIVGGIANVGGLSGNITLYSGVNQWKFDNSGNLTIPSNTVKINFANGSPAFANLVQWTTAPVANTSAGTAGQAAYDSGGNLYVCVSTNTWAKFSGTTSW